MTSFPTGDIPDVPNLDEFVSRMQQASASAEEFANAASQGAATQASGQSQQAAPVIDNSLIKDLLSAVHMIHDELVSMNDSLKKMTE
jgi:hypothetical protein